ncbi:MAG: DNA replication/repair protein RecF [Bacilli bacterium]|nr:DNA replication/repair protein RecF [Bacilli bacterium]
MIVRKINLINFRNYNKISISFDKKLNIFIGDNAQGKTNILESIYFLALTKSYRTADTNLIKKDSESLKVKGEIKDNSVYKSMTVELSNTGKKVKINNNEIKKISDYITNLNVILISPEDINILQGTPAERRNFLNIELSQLSKNYIKKYNEFNRILKIRNNYLKMLYKSSNTDMRYLQSVTENLIEREIDIYSERKNFIDKLNDNISNIYEDITGIKNFKILYETNVDLGNFSKESIRNNLEKKYNSNLNKEIENGMTLYGPHRDDIQFMIKSDDIKLYGSQGQQKVAIIALKLSEIAIFKEMTDTYPIILLDDIFSELDVKTRNKLINYINGDMQVIITSNDTRGINKKFLNNAKLFKVIKGNVIEKVGDNNGKQ